MRLSKIKILFAGLFLAVLVDIGVALAFEGTRDIRAQWTVEKKSGGGNWSTYWLVNQKFPELRQEMFIAGPIAGDYPWISNVVEVDKGKGIYLIIYYAGQPGTSELVETFYALIYDAGGKALLGLYPYSRKSCRNDYSPKWTFGNNRILIEDEDAKPVVILY